MPVTAQQVQAEISQFMGQNQRTVEPVIPSILRRAEEEALYIFNVSPWPYMQNLGTLGTRVVPACEEGRRYSKPLVIPGTVVEYVPANESQMRPILHDGEQVANDIVGIGPHLMPYNSLVRRGCFVSHSNPPKAEEVAEAHEKLLLWCDTLIKQANDAAAQSPKVLQDMIAAEHYTAAKIRKKTPGECPWLVGTVQSADRADCPFCMTAIPLNVPKCPNCKEIVNQKAYDSAQASIAGKKG